MLTYGLNIETEANESMLAAMPDPEVKIGNLRDPAKIQEKLREAKTKSMSSMALDPYFGCILSVTICRRMTEDAGAGGIKSITLFPSMDGGERAVLIALWQRLVKAEAFQLVTFNGAAFDVPFLKIRSLFCGITPDDVRIPSIETGQYRTMNLAGGHVDMMNVLHGMHPGTMQSGRTLGFYAQHLLNEEFPYGELDQSQLGKVAASGDAGRRTIASLSEWNATRALMLYERLATVI